MGQFRAAAAGAAWYESPVPAPGSRYARFRRRLAPVALVIAVGVLVHETCKHDDVTTETIELRFGTHVAEIRHLRADVIAGGVPVAHVERDVGVGGPPVRFAVDAGGEHPRIQVDLTTASGPRRIERELVLEAGATVVVDLSRELDAPANTPSR